LNDPSLKKRASNLNDQNSAEKTFNENIRFIEQQAPDGSPIMVSDKEKNKQMTQQNMNLARL